MRDSEIQEIIKQAVLDYIKQQEKEHTLLLSCIKLLKQFDPLYAGFIESLRRS